MRFSGIALASLFGSALCAPTEHKARAESFPIPYIGESLQDYTGQLISFLSNLFIGSPEKIDVIARIAPIPSIDFNLDFLAAISEIDHMPNYGAGFDAIDGVDASKVKWLVEVEDRTEDDPVIFYTHGGGYVFGLFPMMPGLFQDVWKQVNLKNNRVSVLLVDYPIAPNQGTYPSPLQLTAAAYNQLTKSCKNIILAGDSAGGTLTISLMRHIKYPVDTVQPVTFKPQGFIGLSPWVNVNPVTKNGTFATFDNTDLLSQGALLGMGTTSIPNEEERNSVANNAWKDHIDWSDVLPEDKSKIFVSYGEAEVLSGDIKTWLSISGLDGSAATIFPDPVGCDGCLFASGGHDNAIFNLKQSHIYQPLIDFLVDKF